MMWRRLWPDRLGNQIALLIALALLLEFWGSEWLFRRFEQQRVDEQHVVYLIDTLVRADRIIADIPPAKRPQHIAEVWNDGVQLQWHSAPPSSALVVTEAKPMLLEASGKAAARQLKEFHIVSAGHIISGRWRLKDGSWLSFTSQRPKSHVAMLQRHIGSFLILLASLIVISMIIARQISRPLGLLADHADGVGRTTDAPAREMGSYEVRRVARAYNDLQARMAFEVEDRVQSLAAVSHDLRTPIARMRLRVGQVENADLREQMEQDLMEMNSFIDAVLDYLSGSDPESDQLTNVGSLLMTIAHGYQDMGQDVDYIGPSLLEFSTRPVKLQRVVSNLVQNAVRHAGSAKIYADFTQKGLEIRVEDDGAGIAADQLERVFEPFTRLEESRNRKTGGVGLGLSIVRRMLDRMDGHIRLENRAEGGLRAIVALPYH
jgi:signal transduction histidine kinase